MSRRALPLLTALTVALTLLGSGLAVSAQTSRTDVVEAGWICC
jgi:hypothetical protein